MSDASIFRRVPPTSLAVGLTVLCLIPFVNKAVHVDDTVYLWVAEQIRAHPFDFFGFEKNWYDRVEPMHGVNMNPPGISYAFAIGSLIFGFGEVGMHLVQIVFAAIAAVGFVRLARVFEADPAITAATAILTPAFVVSGTTLMCEPALLACYVWSLALWVDGVDQKNSRGLIIAAVIVGLGLLTKYIMITAVPLLAAYALSVEKKATRTLVCLVAPLAMLTMYELYTFVRYDAGAFQVAASYALGTGGGSATPTGGALLARTFTTLAYLGGGVAIALLLAPWLWNRQQLLYVAAGMFAVMVLFVSPLTNTLVDNMMAVTSRAPSFSYRLQLGLWIGAGLHVVALAANDLHRNRDPKGIVLGLLIGGMFVFSAYVNWSTNVRSLIPLLPAVALLVARQREREDAPTLRAPIVAGLILAGVLSLLVARADYNAAQLDRIASEQIAEGYADAESTSWYMGRWGMRWYLDKAGLRALEVETLESIPPQLQQVLDQNPGLQLKGLFTARAGDYLIVAEHHSQYVPDPATAELVEELQYTQRLPLSTHSFAGGGGFYATKLGVVPFAFGTVDSNIVHVYRFTRDVRTVIAQP